MKILLLSHLFPEKENDFCGINNYSRVKSLRRLGNEIIIAKPVSVFPPMRFLFPVPDFKMLIMYIRKVFSLSYEYTLGGFTVYNLKWVPLPRKFFWWHQIYTFHFCVKRKIKYIINNHKPDVILTVAAHPEGTYSRFLKSFCGCPVISITEGSEILVYPELYKGIGKIVSHLNKYSDLTLFVSDYMAFAAVERFKFTNWQVVKNGYDTSVFNLPENHVERPVRKIVCVGSLESVKGQYPLLEAMKELPGFELTLVGDGRLYSKYMRCISEKYLSGHVRIIKQMNQTELRELYLKSDLMCQPSKSESFCVAALEALACGLPVIASDMGEMSKVIENGMNGFILRDLSPECIANTIIMASKLKWDKRKIAGSVKGYSWDKWAEEITEIAKRIKASSNVK